MILSVEVYSLFKASNFYLFSGIDWGSVPNIWFELVWNVNVLFMLLLSYHYMRYPIKRVPLLKFLRWWYFCYNSLLAILSWQFIRFDEEWLSLKATGFILTKKYITVDLRKRLYTAVSLNMIRRKYLPRFQGRQKEQR